MNPRIAAYYLLTFFEACCVNGGAERDRTVDLLNAMLGSGY